MVQYLRTWFFAVFLLVSFSFAAPPKNVIFLIGDGMGFEQVKAAGIYANGAAGTLSFESLPYQADCTTYSADSGIGYTNYTDSAAAGTALATGHKVNNGVVSVAIPSSDGVPYGSEYETLLEYFKARGKATGLVTTAYITHATPACYGAHEADRNNYTNIANDYLIQTLPNLLMGGGKYVTSSPAAAAGYTVVTDENGMDAVNTDTVTYLAGLFGNAYMPYEYEYDYDLGNLPQLHEMTITALDILDNDTDGFFLMVEGARIDHAGHSNYIQANIHETIEFANATQVVMDWAAGRTDTLVIITADHETGGLTVTETNPTEGVYPAVIWYWGSHTGQNVPVYAMGVNAECITGTMDNTDFFDICISDELPADLNGDLKVDLVDFSRLAAQWQAGKDVSDLRILADSWLY